MNATLKKNRKLNNIKTLKYYTNKIKHLSVVFGMTDTPNFTDKLSL